MQENLTDVLQTLLHQDLLHQGLHPHPSVNQTAWMLLEGDNVYQNVENIREILTVVLVLPQNVLPGVLNKQDMASVPQLARSMKEISTVVPPHVQLSVPIEEEALVLLEVLQNVTIFQVVVQINMMFCLELLHLMERVMMVQTVEQYLLNNSSKVQINKYCFKVQNLKLNSEHQIHKKNI